MPSSFGPQELLLIDMMSFFQPRASASCASVVLAAIRRRPTKVAAGAAPETPRLLLPTAPATPAQAVPW
ncbi:MAG: hypothetical protein QM765_11460 [Myxococcales bacterium]